MDRVSKDVAKTNRNLTERLLNDKVCIKVWVLAGSVHMRNRCVWWSGSWADCEWRGLWLFADAKQVKSDELIRFYSTAIHHTVFFVSTAWIPDCVGGKRANEWTLVRLHESLCWTTSLKILFCSLFACVWIISSICVFCSNRNSHELGHHHTFHY